MDSEFHFTPEHDGTIPIESAVYQALGAASMCWSETPAGIFNDRRAGEIGLELLKLIRRETA